MFVGLAGVLEVLADVAGKRHRGADRGVLKSASSITTRNSPEIWKR